MNTTAGNIANMNTQGSTTDLAKEIPNQIVAQNVNSANVSAIKTQDQMLGSLLDIKA
jgi:flagellar hook protein FlgE